MLKVLSLFDGIATGRLALEMAGIDVGLYFASEVDKDVKAVARANWPDMIHLGPVETITATDLPDIDLVIGGSPCQGFSRAGSQLNFNDPRSRLFFDYARILDEVMRKNPSAKFLLENVAIAGIAKAKKWKADNGYTSGWSKVYWPQGVDNLGRTFHLSTMAAVEFMRADAEHNEVPMETCGNKTVPLMRQYFGEGYAGAGFDKEASLELAQDGICTLISWGGVVLWGDHTAAYKYGAEMDPRFIFDVNVRMIMHVLNGFQRRHMGEIDKPMDLAKKDEIINEEQEQLDALVAMGALIGTPTIYFLESENSTADLMNGDFKWNIPVTPTPPLKSATAGVASSRPLRLPKRSPRGGAHENLIPRRRHHRERQRQPVLPRYVRGEARRRARDPLQ